MTDDPTPEELAGSLLPPPLDPGEDPFAPPPPVVMDRTTRAQLYQSPHVHDPDGTCVRNRFRTPCDAPTPPDTSKEDR